jgi:hypothetical protein
LPYVIAEIYLVRGVDYIPEWFTSTATVQECGRGQLVENMFTKEIYSKQV